MSLAKPLFVVIAGVGAVNAADNSANDYWVRVQAGAWFAPVSGSFGYTDNGSKPTEVDVDELGLDGTQTNLYAELSLQLPLFLDVHLGGWKMSNSGSGTLSQNVNIGDETFPVTSDVDSDLNLTDFYGEIAWGLNFDLVGFSIGPAVHVMTFDGTVESSTQKATFEGTIPIPMLSLRGHVNPLDCLGFEAILQGLSLGLSGVDATVIDARLQAIYRPINMVGVVGGYRYVSIDITVEQDNDRGVIDLELSGPFLGLLAQF